MSSIVFPDGKWEEASRTGWRNELLAVDMQTLRREGDQDEPT